VTLSADERTRYAEQQSGPDVENPLQDPREDGERLGHRTAYQLSRSAGLLCVSGTTQSLC
jgi:hypothetical protein